MKTNKSVDAWNKFCESLKDTGQILLEEKTPQDETTQADGLRYLVHMIRAGFENTYEFSDVTRPVLVPMVSPTLLYEGAGSAARYLQGYIDGGKSYRVYGKRGTAPLLELSLYNGKIGIHEPCHLVAALTEEDIVLEDDGRLEVTIGPEPKPGNHLLSNTDTCFMMIRQYTHVWDETIEGEFFIECLDEQAMQLPSTVSEVSDGLEQTAQFVSTVAQYWSALSDYWIGLLVNELMPQSKANDKTEVAPPTGHQFACGYFRVEPDEALIFEFTPEQVPFWGFEMASYWYQIIGFGNTQSRPNNKTVEYDDSGTVRVYCAHQHPAGVPLANWLDLRGYTEGTTVFRWSRSKQPVPEFKTTLIKLGSVGINYE